MALPPRQRLDSSRELLEELEDGWASKPVQKAAAVALPAPASSASKEEAPAVELDDDIDVDSLDDGWLD